MRKIREQETVTSRMVSEIRAAGLLIERSIRVKTKDRGEVQVKGLEFVNEKLLNELPHDAFAKLRDAGALPLIYAHLLSMANLRQGVLAGKGVNRSSAPEERAPGVSMIDLDSVLAQSDRGPSSKTPAEGTTDFSLLMDDGDFNVSDLSELSEKKNSH
jgi:hypothetical protein